MVELTLVRHGESHGAGTYIGKNSNPSLTPKGTDDVELLLIEKQDLIFSSSQNRAKETAAIISKKLNMDFNILNGLEELDFGIFEGKDYDTLNKLYPKELWNWINDPINLSPPNGETFIDLRNRVLTSISFLNNLINSPKNHKVLIVSHMGPIAIIIINYLKLDLKSFWNYKIERASKVTLKLTNEKSHLI